MVIAEVRTTKVGCCGFPVRKNVYYQNFQVVEIQQTFYQIPQLPTAARWRKESPAGFEYTLKAWQLITHEPSSPTYKRLRMSIPESRKRFYGFFKDTDEVTESWLRTSEFGKALGARIIVFQCPPSFGPSETNIRNLRRFFNRIKREKFRFVWEPRGGWTKQKVEGLCTELNLIPCVDPFDWIPDASRWDTLYLRLHGRKGYRYSYTDEDLASLKTRIEGFGEIYVMFNNTNMFEDAIRFRGMLEPSENYQTDPSCI